RQRTAERSMSLIRVNVKLKASDQHDAKSAPPDWHEHVWVPFSQYTEIEHRRPVTVQIPGVGPLELVYSRRKRSLGGYATLEQMITTYNPGRATPKEWDSHLRLQDASGQM